MINILKKVPNLNSLKSLQKNLFLKNYKTCLVTPGRACSWRFWLHVQLPIVVVCLGVGSILHDSLPAIPMLGELLQRKQSKTEQMRKIYSKSF